MTETPFERATQWASDWSRRWFLGPEQEDRLALPDGASAGWASHVEAFLILRELALELQGQPQERATRVDRLKLAGWDRAIRAIGLRAVRSEQVTSSEPRRIALIAEIPTTSMLEPIRLVAASLPPERRAILSADPRVTRALRTNGISSKSMTLPPRETVRLVRSASSHVRMALDDIVESPPVMPFGDRDVAPHALCRLGRSMRRSLPWLAVEHAALQYSVDHIRPGAIAVASDQHRIGRLAVHVAKEYEIPVTVLQHGLPQSEVGYLPVVADRIAVWSHDSASWFEERGTARERLAILGNPRIDELARSRMESVGRAIGRGLNLLLALSPTARSTNSRVVTTVLAAMDAMPSAQLVIKLHPGHREWGWVDELVQASPSRQRVRTTQYEEVVQLLRWADVTLVHRSTVALESVVARTPVVVVSSDAPSVADLELRDVDLPSATDASSLVDAILVATDPDRQKGWFEDRDPAIAKSAGPLDGRSARRIASTLLQDADAYR